MKSTHHEEWGENETELCRSRPKKAYRLERLKEIGQTKLHPKRNSVEKSKGDDGSSLFDIVQEVLVGCEVSCYTPLSQAALPPRFEEPATQPDAYVNR